MRKLLITALVANQKTDAMNLNEPLEIELLYEDAMKDVQSPESLADF